MRQYLTRNQRNQFGANIFHLYKTERDSAICNSIIKPGKRWRITEDVNSLMVCDRCRQMRSQIEEAR